MIDKVVRDIHELVADYTGIAIIVRDGERSYVAVPLKHMDDYLMPMGESCSDVRKYADKHKISEIVGAYKTLPCLSYGNMQDYVVLLDDAIVRGNVSKAGYDVRITELWGSLVELNPMLKQLNTLADEINSSVKKMRAAIIGVEDCFNISDIDFFLENCLGMRADFNLNSAKVIVSKEYDALLDEVKGIHGRIFWRPSSETLSYIRDKHAGLSPSPNTMHGIDVMQQELRKAFVPAPKHHPRDL